MKRARFALPLVWALMSCGGCNSTSDDATNAAANGSANNTDSTNNPDSSTPALCTKSNPGEGTCECSDKPGFQTYRFNVGKLERCFTVYNPARLASSKTPLVIELNCYSENKAPVEPYADRYDFRLLHITSPDGAWEFPQDGVVNDANYASQCDATSSREFAYLQKVFAHVDKMVADGLVDPKKVHAAGFSQNSMFSLVIATCFPDRLAGIAQGGSGMYSLADGSAATPGCEGMCARSAFEKYGKDCVNQSPCGADCQYWPVYPAKTGQAIRSCIMMYEDDNAAHSTAYPAYKYLVKEGHQPELLVFRGHAPSKLGGHDQPILYHEWVNSCLRIFAPCSSQCEAAVLAAVKTFNETWQSSNSGKVIMENKEAREELADAYWNAKADNEACAANCAASPAMLNSVEEPRCSCLADAAKCDCRTLDTATLPGQCTGK
jgi:hypothetical protein